METDVPTAAQPGTAEFARSLLTVRGRLCPHKPKLRLAGQQASLPLCLAFFHQKDDTILLLKPSVLCRSCYDAALPSGYEVCSRQIRFIRDEDILTLSKEESLRVWLFCAIGLEGYGITGTRKVFLLAGSGDDQTLLDLRRQARPFYLTSFQLLAKPILRTTTIHQETTTRVQAITQRIASHTVGSEERVHGDKSRQLIPEASSTRELDGQARTATHQDRTTASNPNSNSPSRQKAPHVSNEALSVTNREPGRTVGQPTTEPLSLKPRTGGNGVSISTRVSVDARTYSNAKNELPVDRVQKKQPSPAELPRPRVRNTATTGPSVVGDRSEADIPEKAAPVPTQPQSAFTPRVAIADPAPTATPRKPAVPPSNDKRSERSSLTEHVRDRTRQPPPRSRSDAIPQRQHPRGDPDRTAPAPSSPFQRPTQATSSSRSRPNIAASPSIRSRPPTPTPQIRTKTSKRGNYVPIAAGIGRPGATLASRSDRLPSTPRPNLMRPPARPVQRAERVHVQNRPIGPRPMPPLGGRVSDNVLRPPRLQPSYAPESIQRTMGLHQTPMATSMAGSAMGGGLSNLNMLSFLPGVPGLGPRMASSGGDRNRLRMPPQMASRGMTGLRGLGLGHGRQGTVQAGGHNMRPMPSGFPHGDRREPPHSRSGGSQMRQMPGSPNIQRGGGHGPSHGQSGGHNLHENADLEKSDSQKIDPHDHLHSDSDSRGPPQGNRALDDSVQDDLDPEGSHQGDHGPDDSVQRDSDPREPHERDRGLDDYFDGDSDLEGPRQGDHDQSNSVHSDSDLKGPHQSDNGLDVSVPGNSDLDGPQRSDHDPDNSVHGDSDLEGHRQGDQVPDISPRHDSEPEGTKGPKIPGDSGRVDGPEEIDRQDSQHDSGAPEEDQPGNQDQDEVDDLQGHSDIKELHQGDHDSEDSAHGTSDLGEEQRGNQDQYQFDDFQGHSGLEGHGLDYSVHDDLTDLDVPEDRSIPGDLGRFDESEGPDAPEGSYQPETITSQEPGSRDQGEHDEFQGDLHLQGPLHEDHGLDDFVDDDVIDLGDLERIDRPEDIDGSDNSHDPGAVGEEQLGNQDLDNCDDFQGDEVYRVGSIDDYGQPENQWHSALSDDGGNSDPTVEFRDDDIEEDGNGLYSDLEQSEPYMGNNLIDELNDDFTTAEAASGSDLDFGQPPEDHFEDYNHDSEEYGNDLQNDLHQSEPQSGSDLNDDLIEEPANNSGDDFGLGQDGQVGGHMGDNSNDESNDGFIEDPVYGPDDGFELPQEGHFDDWNNSNDMLNDGLIEEPVNESDGDLGQPQDDQFEDHNDDTGEHGEYHLDGYSDGLQDPGEDGVDGCDTGFEPSEDPAFDAITQDDAGDSYGVGDDYGADDVYDGGDGYDAVDGDDVGDYQVGDDYDAGDDFHAADAYDTGNDYEVGDSYDVTDDVDGEGAHDDSVWYDNMGDYDGGGGYDNSTCYDDGGVDAGNLIDYGGGDP